MIIKERKKPNLKDIIKYYYYCLFIPCFSLGILIGTFFSSYRFLLLPISIVFLFSVCLLIFIHYLVNLTFPDRSEYITKILIDNDCRKNNKCKLLFYLGIFIILTFLVTITSLYLFPNTKIVSYDHSYVKTDVSNKVFLKKIITYQIKDIGSNFSFSNWLPLEAERFDLNFLKSADPYIQQDSVIKLIYRDNSSEIINLLDMFSNPYDQQKYIREYLLEKNMFILNTHNFNRENVSEISLIYYVPTIETPTFGIFETTYTGLQKNNSVALTVINNLTLPVKFQDFTIINTESSCHTSEVKVLDFNITIDENVFQGNFECDHPTLCSPYNQREDFFTIARKPDQKTFIFHTDEALNITRIDLSLNLTCN